MAERLASDIAADLRGQRAGLVINRRLLVEAADKLDDLIDCLATAERERNLALEVNERASVTLKRLRAERDEARRERDLAIAHDRQPYPTQWAYDQACKALRKHRMRADRLAAFLKEEVLDRIERFHSAEGTECLDPMHRDICAEAADLLDDDAQERDTAVSALESRDAKDSGGSLSRSAGVEPVGEEMRNQIWDWMDGWREKDEEGQ